MSYYELLLQINNKVKENIEMLNNSGKIDELSACVSFITDIEAWLACCGEFAIHPLVTAALTECSNSIFLCAQGFYKEAFVALRQTLEHFLFALLLSTNDFNYRLWKREQYGMSWKQITDEENGVFSKKFISLYSDDCLTEKSLEMITIVKNVYRDCSEFVHGNHQKLSILANDLNYKENMLEYYVSSFKSFEYILCMALLIRFYDIFTIQENIQKLETIIYERLGNIPVILELSIKTNEV